MHFCLSLHKIQWLRYYDLSSIRHLQSHIQINLSDIRRDKVPLYMPHISFDSKFIWSDLGCLECKFLEMHFCDSPNELSDSKVLWPPSSKRMQFESRNGVKWKIISHHDLTSINTSYASTDEEKRARFESGMRWDWMRIKHYPPSTRFIAIHAY